MQKILQDYTDEDLYLEDRVVRDTSIQAYHQLIRHPHEMNGRYLEYLFALRDIGHPATDLEVTRFCGKQDPNYFRPRRNELADPEHFNPPLVKDCGKRPCTISTITAHQWGLTQEGYTVLMQLR